MLGEEWRQRWGVQLLNEKGAVPGAFPKEGTTLTCSDLDQTEAEY